jgi:hypothetical protein
MVGGDTKEIHAALIRLCAYTFVAEVHSSVAAAIASEGHGRLDRRQHEGSVRYQVKKLMPSKPDIMRTKAMPNGAFEDLLQQMREAVGGGLQAGKKTEGDDGLRCASDGPLAWTLMEEHSDEKYDVRPPPNRFGDLAELSQRLGHSPTSQELQDEFTVKKLQALLAAHGQTPTGSKKADQGDHLARILRGGVTMPLLLKDKRTIHVGRDLFRVSVDRSLAEIRRNSCPRIAGCRCLILSPTITFWRNPCCPQVLSGARWVQPPDLGSRRGPG